MSAWTDFRDGIVDSLKFDEVTEELKEQFSSWLVETVMPLASSYRLRLRLQMKRAGAKSGI